MTGLYESLTERCDECDQRLCNCNSVLLCYLATGEQVLVPDVRIQGPLAAYQEAVPTRGFAHSLAVRDRHTEEFIGWVRSEEL